MNNTTMRPRAARARPKRQSRLACSLEQLFKNAGEVNKWRSGKTDDLRGEDQEMDVSGKCESALDAPSGSRGQGLAGRGRGGRCFCSHCVLWRLLWALLVSPGLGKVRVSEERVGGRPGGPLSQGLLRKVRFVPSPGTQGWKAPSPEVLPKAAWLRTRRCPACPGAGATGWVTHAQARGILSPSPGQGG